jgi:trigger factor
MPEINTTFTYKEVLVALRKSGWGDILPEEDSLDNPDEVCVEFTISSEVDVDEDDDEDDEDDEDDDDDEEDDEENDEDEDPDSLTVPSAAVLSTWKSLD